MRTRTQRVEAFASSLNPRVRCGSGNEAFVLLILNSKGFGVECLVFVRVHKKLGKKGVILNFRWRFADKERLLLK